MKPIETQPIFRLLAFFMLAVLLAGCGEKNRMLAPSEYFTDPDVIALAKAGKRNDVAEIDRLIAKGVNINAKGKGDFTPLFFAFFEGFEDAFSAMLKHGADPNVVETIITKSCVTARAAAIEDNSEWLKLVLEHGGDPDVVVSPRGLKKKYHSTL